MYILLHYKRLHLDYLVIDFSTQLTKPVIPLTVFGRTFSFICNISYSVSQAKHVISCVAQWAPDKTPIINVCYYEL